MDVIAVQHMSVKPAIMIVPLIALLDMVQYAIAIQARMIGVSQIARAANHGVIAIMSAIVQKIARMFTRTFIILVVMDGAAHAALILYLDIKL